MRTVGLVLQAELCERIIDQPGQIQLDITADTIEQFQRMRAQKDGAPVAANRDLQLRRAMFSWAVGRDHLERTPFKKGTETVIKLARETKRRRRLQPGEAERLLAACGPHLRAVVEAAIETGMRRGELLSMQWWQVRFAPKARLFLPRRKPKRRPSGRCRSRRGLRRFSRCRRTAVELTDGPEAVGPNAYVFGNAIGQPVKNIKRAWQIALLVAHGYKPRYVERFIQNGKRRRKVRTAMLTPECLATLAQIDLRFHDLCREAGSRWLDHGVPLHTIRDWLGHTNIAQTSTYLMAESADGDEAMRRYEERLGSTAVWVTAGRSELAGAGDGRTNPSPGTVS